MLSPGDKVRDYEVIAPIRSGGMAMLYLARRRGVGGFTRLVALKLVHAHLTDDPDITRLFLQEARIAASVAHPNVVHVEEVGSADGKYFIAMEYVHGVSLDELLATVKKQGLRMSAKLCVWVAAQVSEALHAVHEATWENGTPLDIVHRDVSPQNILVGHNGHIKLIDFGIAKSQRMSQPGSSRGSVIGKLRYMAPEQLRAQPVTRRTDVYALGVMLWEMLASRNLLRCFRIDDERDWRTREDPPPPSKYGSPLKASIDQVVLKAIAYEPAARHDNAMAFRAALLRAEPGASKVDAPLFAALLHRLLGEELARRRANWPREVNVQLDSAVEGDTDRAFEVGALTVRRKAADIPDSQEDEFEGPTLPDPPALDDEEDSEDETRVEKMSALSNRPLLRAPSVQALIPTIAAPPSSAKAPNALGQRIKALTRKLGIRSTAVAALFVALAAYVLGSTPRLYSRTAVAAGGAQPDAATPRFERVEAPVRLEETRIAFPSSADAALPRPRATSQAPGKRFASAGKVGKKKGKFAAANKGRKLRR